MEDADAVKATTTCQMVGEGPGDGEKVPSATAAAGMLLQQQQQVAALVLFSRNNNV